MPLDAIFNTPFKEQVDFFRQKINLPTERWDDIAGAAHDRAFVVAGAMKADLIADLRQAVGHSIEQGKSLDWFRKEFDRIVAERGWTGWTGEGSQAGVAWRTRVIYQTNMATSYAAGRWAQLNDPELASIRPYWRYVHSDLVDHPRPQHQAWNGLVLHKDDPFWNTHFPPNGWGCHCTVKAASRAEQAAAAAKGLTAAPTGWDEPQATTGSPPGIDKGWAHAPGANTTRPLLEMVSNKLLALESPVGAAMWAALKPALQMEQQLALYEMIDAVTAKMQATGSAALAHVVSPDTLTALADRGIVLASADVWLRDTELLHAMRDSKHGRDAALSVDMWRRLPTLLGSARAYLDTTDRALVYAIDADEGVGKIVVRVNYKEKIRESTGKRTKITSNFIRTGGIVEPFNIDSGSQYELLSAT